MAPVYQVTRVALVPGTPTSRVRFLDADNRRVSLVVTFATSAVFYIGVDSAGGDNNLIVVMNTPGYIVMPFRDYGPIIQQSIWLGQVGGTGNAIVNGIQ